MGGREDDGGGKMKRSRSARQEDDGASSSKAASAHKREEEEQHSRSDGGERYVCVYGRLCDGGWEKQLEYPSSSCLPLSSHHQPPHTRLRPQPNTQTIYLACLCVSTQCTCYSLSNPAIQPLPPQ